VWKSTHVGSHGRWGRFSWGLGHFGVLERSFTPFEYDANTAVDNFATLGDPNKDHVVPAMVAVVEAAVPPQAAAAPGEQTGREFKAELAAHLDLIANLSLDDSSNQCIPMVIDIDTVCYLTIMEDFITLDP
jgi:hypothetical protein